MLEQLYVIRRCALGQAHLEIQPKCDQVLLGPVVEIAFDPAALCVLGADQAVAGRLELFEALSQLYCQPRVANCQASVERQIMDHRHVSGRERLAGTRPDKDQAEAFAPMLDVDAVPALVCWELFGRRSLGPCCGWAQLAVVCLEPNLDRFNAGAFGYRAGHLRHESIGLIRMSHPSHELAQRLVGTDPATEHEPVRKALHACTRRLERDGDQCRGEGGGHRVRSAAAPPSPWTLQRPVRGAPPLPPMQCTPKASSESS